MKVFKFGGASIASVERIKGVASILERYRQEKILIVISAMGKTTNALEKMATFFFEGNKKEALAAFEKIKQDHIAVAKALENKDTTSSIQAPLSDFFTEVEWLLHDKPVRHFDYYYDQMVCLGELLSSTIVSHFLNLEGLLNRWIDVRDVIRTDSNFRDAAIDWPLTSERVNQLVQPLFLHTNFVLTQGFIGATDENESTTLGREGSDYSAAVFANILNADEQVIWKDVQGVMNADPKQYSGAQGIEALSYREVIEMAYYGAQVIHPKTIKPLQNKGIPLYVRSFIEPNETGTCIHNKSIHHLPPIIVYKYNQVLMQFLSKDFSFVSEGLTSELDQLFERLKFKPNLTQIAAISVLHVADEHVEKINLLAHDASSYFDVTLTKDLTLLTIRHYTPSLLTELCKGFEIVLQQQTPETMQVVMRSKMVK